MNLSIRIAQKEDMAKVMDLVNELAKFEKAPNEVKTTENILIEDGFGLNPLFKCFVAEGNAGIVGFALYYFRYSTWKGKCLYLEDLYVKEAFRNFGIGKKLMDSIIETAKHDRCKRISWQVLEWNEDAIRFYRKYDANFDKEWWNGSIDL